MRRKKSTYVSTLFLLISLFFSLTSDATSYYVSSSSGNDNNSGTDPSSPWQTLNKLNSFRNFSPGDNIYFKRGDTFYGSITINNSGSAGNPITFDAYGSGNNPIITGFTTISSWNNLGGNIWESSSAVSSLSTCNLVSINGVNTPMGRYPNSGYLTYQSYSGNTSISSSSLDGSNNWTGAEAVIRRDRYAIDRNFISSQQGGTLFLSGGGITPTKNNNYGFFIQNSSKTLDSKNEWYFNPTNRKIQIYLNTMPQNVQVASIETIVSVVEHNYVVFSNLSFTGSNNTAFSIARSNNITIENCIFDFNYNAILAEQPNQGPIDHFTLKNSVINHTNNNAIVTNKGTTNALISGNIIKNTGLFPGMGVGYGSDWTTYQAMFISGINTIVENNELDSIGYMGIGFDADFVTIKNNFINHFCLVKDDGAGIYTHGSGSNRIISNNIVLNGIGNGEGTYPIAERAIGIYCDDMSSNVQVIGNSVANVGFAGIYLHNAKNISLRKNTTFNNGLGFLIESDLSNFFVRDISVFDNIFCAATIGAPFTSDDQRTIKCGTTNDDISSFGYIDSNYYAKPIDENSSILATLIGVKDNNFNLAEWQSYSGFDSHSRKSPKAISNTNDLRFEYNSTSSSKTISLDANYLDVKGNSFSGSITLAPYSSAVLIKNGPTTNQSPTADAGSDQTIILPNNSVSLSGTGSDADGSISAYNWTQVSGPSSGTFTSPNSASTTVKGLVEGSYVFQLKVTDNKEATGTSTVKINVGTNGGTNNNISPVANAGGNGTITLPQNNVELTGTGTDVDGTIQGYNWTQISGPGQVNFGSPNSAKTTVSDMVAGSYVFQLKVTDNEGAIGTSTVQINVIRNGITANISPVANAGGNGTIILPQSSVDLTGTGTDVDGTIQSYNWSQVSGPGQGNFTSPHTAKTSVTNLIAGSYVFQLKVFDNDGATGTSTVQINVVGSSNVAPVANAGENGTITLPINLVFLTGTGTDADGTISSYKWTQLSGPAQGNISSPNSAPTTVTGLIAGSYVFQLMVTDNDGASGTSTVKINVVNPANALTNFSATNLSPIANAGENGTVKLPTDIVFLTGTGSDPDGTISAYNWSQLSGPSGARITNPDSGPTTVTGLTVGTYVFQFMVTDNEGATGTSTVKIDVVNGTQSFRVAAQNAVDSLSLNSNQSLSDIQSSAQDATVYQQTIPSYQVKVFPNPFQTNFKVSVSGSAGKYTMMILDESGKVLITKSGEKTIGDLQLDFDGSTYTSGLLFLHVNLNNEKSTIKLIKK